MSDRRRRAWPWALLAAVVIALPALAVLERRALLEWAILGALRERGIERASLSIERFGADALSIGNVRIGDDDLALRTLDVRFSLAGLLDERLDAVRIEGLAIHGTLTESGVQLGALDALRTGDARPEAELLPVLPAARLEIEDATLTLDTARGPYVATLAVELDAAGDGRVAMSASAFPGLDTALGLDAKPFALEGSVAFRPERLELSLEPAPFELALGSRSPETGEDGGLRIVGTTPALELSTAPDDVKTLQIATREGELHLPDRGISLRGFELEARFDTRSRLPKGRLAVRDVRDTSETPRFPAVAFAGELRPDGERLVLEGVLAALDGRLMIDVTGVHDPARGTGRADLRLDSLRLAPDGIRPQDLFPGSATLLQAAEGTLVADGELSWDEAGVAGFVDLGLQDLTLRTPNAVLERINAAARLDGPWPLRMQPGQLVSMARLDFGLELTNGLIDYELRQGGVVEIASAEWEFAGGMIRTRGTVDLLAGEQRIVLDVRDVDLARLLELVNLDGLSGSGRLRGKLPVVRRRGKLEIRNAVLEASDPGGWVRYTPKGRATAFTSAAGAAMDDLLIALRNFRYETLRLTVNGEAQGEVTVALSLHGANPEHRDGQPYEFNLSVEGRLGDMVRQSEAAYRIPARIQQRLDEIAQGAR